MQKKYNLYFLLAIFLTFGITLIIHQSFTRPEIVVSKEETAVNLNREFLKLFSSGHKRIISSALWIITLLEADDVHYQKKDGNSWMYHRFMSIADLEPLFYQNYFFGGMFLSIIKDDVNGAAILYERGLSKFPDDFNLNYNAGFNYYFEMGDFKRGLEKLEKTLSNPKTPWTVKFLVNKLRFELTNEYDTTIGFLRYNLSITKDESLKTKLKSDIYAVKAEKDLKCLNENKMDCDRNDEEGKPYLYREGKWKSDKNYSPFKIHRK